MSPRKRKILIGVVVGLLLVEVVLRFSARPQAVVEVINHGSADILDLQIFADGDTVKIDRIAPQTSGFAKLSARRKGKIRLTYNQPGSAISAVQFDDFDPAALISDREKYVVELTDTGYRQVREDLGSADDGLLGRLGGVFGEIWEGRP